MGSLAIVKEGKKVVCGSQTGPLAVFSWGDFGDLKVRIKGHPMSVDAMVKLTEDAVLTGSSDGRIRAVAVHNRELGSCVLGTLGEHADAPIESLALSPDGSLVVSAAHGEPSVQLWSTELAHKLLRGEADKAAEEPKDDDEEADSDDSDEKPKKKRRKKGK